MNKGTLYAMGAYTIWGVLPVFWKLLQHVPSIEVVSHRTVWSFVFVAGLLLLQRRWHHLRQTLRSRRIILIYLVIATLIGLNWLTYIWAVNSGHIVETSLGYFVNPLLSVLLGVIFLKERLRPWQWAAIGIAAAGVLYLTIQYGQLPWIALSLALYFGLYGLIKKMVNVEALEGMGMETAWLSLVALGYLLFLEGQGTGTFGHTDLRTNLLLALTGAVTAIPLLLFAAATRRIPLTTIGILQYIAPTLQFLIGVLVYGEPFGADRVVGFSIIWTALLIYTAEGMMVRRKRAILAHKPG